MDNLYKFSSSSKAKLSTCSPNLQLVFNKVIPHFDCTIVEGYRGKAQQEDMFLAGLTKAHFGQSKHNCEPSKAVDVVPYFHGIDWRGEINLRKAIHDPKLFDEILHNIERWCYFAGFVKGIAAQLGIRLRWGGDWNRNNNLMDQSFDDWPHFEED